MSYSADARLAYGIAILCGDKATLGTEEQLRAVYDKDGYQQISKEEYPNLEVVIEGCLESGETSTWVVWTGYFWAIWDEGTAVDPEKMKVPTGVQAQLEKFVLAAGGGPDDFEWIGWHLNANYG